MSTEQFLVGVFLRVCVGRLAVWLLLQPKRNRRLQTQTQTDCRPSLFLCTILQIATRARPIHGARTRTILHCVRQGRGSAKWPPMQLGPI